MNREKFSNGEMGKWGNGNVVWMLNSWKFNL